MDKIIYYRKFFVTVILLIGIISLSAEARQFRLFSPIASSEHRDANSVGAVPVDNVVPLPREVVEPLVREIIDRWNSAGMSDTLSDEFYDKSRLLDVMDTSVPRDAKLRVQSIQGIQTLNQYIMPNQAKGRNEMISFVSATVRTQLEFNNASGAFVSRTGTNELILKITTSAR